MILIPLPNKNKRTVIVEKHVVPQWIKDILSTKGYQHIIHNNNQLETYRIFLRIFNNDDMTVTKGREVEINKWRKNPEKINIDLAWFMIEYKIVGLDSGNMETGEQHYNFFMAP